MRYERAELSRDARVAVLAGRQHGVVTRRQLAALGLDHSAVARRVRAGRLHQVHRNVFAVGHTGLTTRGLYLSAVLAYGNKAVLSHRSAAALWGIRPDRRSTIDVTVNGGGSRARRPPIVVHRSPLRDGDTTVRDRIPVTTPTRTIADLADCLSRRELERAVDEATYLHLDLTSLRPLPGRVGRGRLAGVLTGHAPGTTRTKSPFEERLLALCRDRGLPEPLVNQHVESFEVDFVWPGPRLILEADGWSAHGRRSSFERDRLRDAELQVAGWRVVRVTWRRIEHEPDAVAAQLARLIGVERAA
jgi:very-short-patch-repair endonuclease